MNCNSKDSAKFPPYKVTSLWDTLHLLTVIHLEEFPCLNFSQSVALFVLSRKMLHTSVQKEDGTLLLYCMRSFHLLS